MLLDVFQRAKRGFRRNPEEPSFPSKVEPHGFFLKICFCDEWKTSGIWDVQIRDILLLKPKHSRF
jgi:hypothetical protein